MKYGKLKITPDTGKKIHEEGAIKQLRQFFKDHGNGLPELVKNASDEYVRRGFPEDNRVICVLFQNSKGGQPGTVSVLDFGGITSSTLETKLSVWADPDASKGDDGAETQGGKGNGGKAYLSEMFEVGGVYHTLRDGLACDYGLAAGKYVFGYSPDAASGKDKPVNDAEGYLDQLLSEIGYSVAALPSEAREALRYSQGFTLATGIGPKHVTGRIPAAQWRDGLREHDQMEISLDLSKVFVLAHGKLTDTSPLTVPTIPPLPGADEVRVIDVPGTLEDPLTGAPVSTMEEGALPTGRLELRTSAMSLQRSKRSNVKFRAAGAGYYGAETVRSMGVMSQWRDRIYGTCFLDAGADLALNDRGALADSPLKRALTEWIGQQIQTYCQEFEVRERRESSQKERNELSRLNEVLDEWKNELLRAEVEDFEKDDDGGGGGGGGGGGRGPLPKGVPARIEVLRMPEYAGVGVPFKPTVSFLDASGEQIAPVAYRWVSSDSGVVDTDDDLNVLTTRAPGKTDIYAETYDAKARSTAHPVEVLHILQIDLDPQSLSIPMGQKRFVKTKSTTVDGRIVEQALLRWDSTNEIVAITTPMGGVAGLALGTAGIVASDDNAESTNDAAVTVVPPEGDGGGKRFPRILVSGVDLDPDYGVDVELLEDQPPIVQRPEDIDRKIWWINSSAPLAKMLLDKFSVASPEWRLYHVDRYVDALTQIFLALDGELGEERTGELWLQDIGIKASQVQTHAAKTLGQFIARGDAPEESE